MKKFTPPPVGAVAVADAYLAPRIAANHAATIKASLAFSRKTGRIDAFRLAWKKGDPKEPHVFWDSDVAKVVEGMAYDLILHPGDKALAEELDRVVDLIVSAQRPDGYLNTHFTLVEPENRFKQLHAAHELYCAGHIIEAAIAHRQATGSAKFLDCACRYADYLGTVFGRGKGKRRGYPGHEEIELALCKLADATGRRKYLALAKYFVDERGRKPNYFASEGLGGEGLANLQAAVPVRELPEASGHAVRMVYLLCGMADVAAATGDGALLDACARLAGDIAATKLFVTGAIGQARHGEAFDRAYKLDNLDAYGESCAAMGLVWFLQRMHNITGDGAYLDTLERALYNGALAGISLSGDRFFYQNPLRSSADSPYVRERVDWFGCSCCPTNYCRFLPQIGAFLWSESAGEARLNIPAASTLRSGGRAIRVTGGYPYSGDVLAEVLADGDFAFSLRIPGWCRKFAVARNGRKAAAKAQNGFVTLPGPWKAGDTVELLLEMPVRAVRAHSDVEDDFGKLSLARGPLVYALESVDNGERLHRLCLPAAQDFRLGLATGLPEGTVSISGEAVEFVRPGDALYSTAAPRPRKRRFTAVPFALWQNRGPAEMAVWIHEKA